MEAYVYTSNSTKSIVELTREEYDAIALGYSQKKRTRKQKIHYFKYNNPDYPVLILNSDEFNAEGVKAIAHALQSFLEINLQVLQKSRTDAANQLNKLRHNLETNLGIITQEIESFAGQSKLSEYRGADQLRYLATCTKDRPQDVAKTILKIYKCANISSADIDVFRLLNGGTVDLDFQSHVAHKIIMLNLIIFWADFQNERIKVIVTESTARICCDYRTFMVVLTHLFDNCTKYVHPNTEINIRIEESRYECKIEFYMTSLAVNPSELSKIWNESYSGENARSSRLNGSGLGLSVVKKLIELNQGKIIFKSDVSPKVNRIFNNAEYVNNLFEITLPKYC